MVEFRKSTLEDVEAMGQIADAAKQLLASRGIEQWKKGTYPDRALFAQDVADGIGYVVTVDGEVAGVCAITTDEDPSYIKLDSGEWLTPARGQYVSVHRLAISRKFLGQKLTTVIFQAAIDMAAELGFASVRGDTHPDNQAMQRSLEKAGFVRTGVLTLATGDEAGDIRWGYERLIG